MIETGYGRAVEREADRAGRTVAIRRWRRELEDDDDGSRRRRPPALLLPHGGGARQRGRNVLSHRIVQQVDRRRRSLRTYRGYPTTAGGHALGAPPLGDFHDIWIDPGEPDRMVVSNDGGIGVTLNPRAHLRTGCSCRIAQLYHVATDNRIPYYVYGNRQDGTSFTGPSNSRVFGYGQFVGAISRGLWQAVGGGESGWSISRSGRSEHCVVERHGRREPRRHHRSIRCSDRPIPARGDLARRPASVAGRGSQVSLQLDVSGGDLAARSQQGVRRQPVRAHDDGRRSELAGDQPRSDARTTRVKQQSSGGPDAATTSASSTATCYSQSRSRR